MTIKLGPISGVVVHLTTAEDWAPTTQQPTPSLLCTSGGDRLAVRTLHTWTADRNRVTCKACLEWLHA